MAPRRQRPLPTQQSPAPAQRASSAATAPAVTAAVQTDGFVSTAPHVSPSVGRDITASVPATTPAYTVTHPSLQLTSLMTSDALMTPCEPRQHLWYAGLATETFTRYSRIACVI